MITNTPAWKESTFRERTPGRLADRIPCGACVLHVTPESFIGGPMARVRNGDPIELDVPARN
jgi:dihydroxyacid dehydratase/phosphogluconate dehydratase